MKEVILDVRESDEFEAEHVEGAIHLPLSRLACLAPGILGQLKDRPFLLMCRSGARARLALQQMEASGLLSGSIKVFEGGLLEWKRQGNPTILRKESFPVIRQVQLIVGFSLLAFSALGYWVSPHYLFGTVFFGLGLSIAGLTGYCGLANLLMRMPWNQVRPMNHQINR